MEILSSYDNKSKFARAIELVKEYIKSLLSLRDKRKSQNLADSMNGELLNVMNWSWSKNIPYKEAKNNQFEFPPEDQDEYIPHDAEFGESIWEQSRFAEIYPAFLWYYSQGKKSYFDRNTNLWSKKKILSSFSHTLPENIKKYTYTWVITAWINAIPLPDCARPDTNSLCAQCNPTPEFKKDQNGCVYLISEKKQFISFTFWLDQYSNTKSPVSADTEKIIFDTNVFRNIFRKNTLSHNTQELLNKLKESWASAQQIAAAIKYYIIKNKRYSTKVQWTLRNKSNRNNYIIHLDESPILECFSANSLCVALCRELGVPARLVVGHMIQSTNNEWKACITKNDWHAWSEIWDENQWQWIRVDATPTQKEDGEKSHENGQEQNKGQNNNADNNFDDNQEPQPWQQPQKSWNQWQNSQQNNQSPASQKNKDEKSDTSQDNSSPNDLWYLRESQQNQSSKSPQDLLNEMIEKAKEDNLVKHSDKIQNTLDKLEEAETKEEIKDIIDKSGLSDFAKDIVDKLWEEKILDEEKKELESLEDEDEIDEALKNSLLNEEYKQKLKEYAKIMKKKIEEEKKKMKSEMEKFWFNEDELQYYKEYKQLEKEIEPEVRKQIRELQILLPPQYQIVRDDNQSYRSWPILNGSRLVEFEVTWDQSVFTRNKEIREHNEINMFETIVIDTSGSMGRFERSWSILRESIKAAIIRAKVLEHFKVEFSIILFWDRIDEVMSFWENFSSKRKCLIPSKLIRAAHISWWNSQEPISYVYQNMLNQFKKHRWKSFGNISFIGDGDLCNWQERSDLKTMIEDLKHRGFWVTAYYVNDSWSRLCEYYFWAPENWWTIYAGDSKALSTKIIEAHKTHLAKQIKKYVK